MTQTEITTIKNNTVVLPKTWKGSRVFVRVTGNEATIIKVPSSKKIFTENEIVSVRRLGKNLSKAALAKAIRSARRG